MPMFDYKCGDCGTKREHFVYPNNSFERPCPKCGSSEYKRQFSLFKSNVEYSDTEEHMKRVIDPAVAEVYQQIGKESLDEDANTLENIFGTEKVKATIAESDE